MLYAAVVGCAACFGVPRSGARLGGVPPAERIATFDNDGTLWSEQAICFQLAFALDRVKALATQHPEWKTTQPFKAVVGGDTKAPAASGTAFGNSDGDQQMLQWTAAGTGARSMGLVHHRLRARLALRSPVAHRQAGQGARRGDGDELDRGGHAARLEGGVPPPTSNRAR